MALRSLFRVLALEEASVAHLDLAIPVVRYTRNVGLPGGLSEQQLEQLWRAIDVRTAIGLRARAIIECLVTLGLRAGEVAGLRFNDIDWRAGTLCVQISKVRRGDTFPLPARVGRAVAAYPRRGRPATKSNHVLVRHYMPVGQALRSSDVTGTVRRAFGRAGLHLPSMGAHVLRHTTASRLVRAGVSFKQVADVMRHCHIDTTRIYTKVDWPRLADVALPWPTAVASRGGPCTARSAPGRPRWGITSGFEHVSGTRSGRQGRSSSSLPDISTRSSTVVRSRRMSRFGGRSCRPTRSPSTGRGGLASSASS